MQNRDKFNYIVDQFDDMRILKYELPGFETLTTKQKELIYYLGEAALWAGILSGIRISDLICR